MTRMVIDANMHLYITYGITKAVPHIADPKQGQVYAFTIGKHDIPGITHIQFGDNPYGCLVFWFITGNAQEHQECHHHEQVLHFLKNFMINQ